MREREVKQRLAEQLRKEGFMNLNVRYGQEHRIDIEAQFPRSRRWLYIEVKGERPGGQEAAKRRAALGEALLQILSVYDGSAVCAIALPFTRGYQNLVRQILVPLQRLELHMIFVREGEIWHLAPGSQGFLPQKVAALMEALER
jgi:hypothetical protein